MKKPSIFASLALPLLLQGQDQRRLVVGREAFGAVVLKEDPHSKLLGVGVAVFVCDDFLLTLKTPPFFWVGPELIKRLMLGQYPVLSDKEIRRANDTPLHEVLAKPHYLGLTRELALSRPGTWVGSLFVHQRPQFGFRPILASSASCSPLWGAGRTRT